MVLVWVIVIAAVVLVLLIFAAARLLYDFALDPSSRFSMKRMLHSGKVKDVSSTLFSRDNPEIARAYDFFAEKAGDVSVTAEDGQVLGGYIVEPSAQTSHTWALLCHGYTGKPRDMATFAVHFYEAGMGVLMPAARGHEKNEHTGPVQMGWKDSRDLLAWLNLIVERDASARILLLGVSMGGAEVMMASGLDLPEQVKLIIEDCGYTSVWDEFAYQAKRMFKLPTFPVLNLCDLIARRKAGFGFKEASALKRLKRAKVPMLFIHGTEDAFVPFFMMGQCAAAYGGPSAQTLAVPGAGHGESALKDGKTYWETADGFIAEHL